MPKQVRHGMTETIFSHSELVSESIKELNKHNVITK